MVKKPPTSSGDVGSISGSGRSLEKEVATQSSILAWEIPWTEEPGGLWSRGVTKESDMIERLNKNKKSRQTMESLDFSTLTVTTTKEAYKLPTLLKKRWK